MSALSGITVLELAEGVAGEYCGKLLAELGAQVIKLERPGCGSPTRRMGPFVDSVDAPESSGLFAFLNMGKHSVEYDLGAASPPASFSRLLEKADVVIDDHSAQWLTDWGLDEDAAAQSHPELVLCSITPFGLNPPEDRQFAEDLQVFHTSGLGYHTPSGADEGRPPLKGAGRFLPSYEAGMEAALCIIACLSDGSEPFQGRFIEVSKQSVMASRSDYVLAQMIAGDMDVSPSRHQFDLGGPAGIFPCQDGFVYLWMSAPAHWEALHQLIDDNSWMADFPDRWMELECTPERVATCRQHIGAWLKNQHKQEIEEAAQKLGLILVAVNNVGDLLASPQYQYRHYFAEMAHSKLGTTHYPTAPYTLSKTPTQAAVSPLLGQHTADLDILAGGTTS
ncbi:CoA transferase [Spongiibacter nanhainus]|uniref:CoA transferase n=1 Tax=Spongiibacter nanhainus TaxID=2794344 RepID=A0A7T4R3C1_9GAMM|nr:CoA transferase [Spongiibacter nanhainus]QQD19489.1 CoA transferase [Spongiibacter nanhainus]